MSLSVSGLAAGSCLPAFQMTTPGHVTSVRISAFRAGKAPHDAAERMASAAEDALKQARHPLRATMNKTFTGCLYGA